MKQAIIDKIDKLLQFDGITLGVWGQTSNTEGGSFFINFDIDVDVIFSLLSFDEYEYTHNEYEVSENDIFVLDSLFDVLMNFRKCGYKYINEKSVNLYIPAMEGNARLSIRLVNDEYVIMSYEKIMLKEGRRPDRIGIYNHDTGEYDDFPESFEVDNVDSCYYSFV